jgi:hypothetical protein
MEPIQTAAGIHSEYADHSSCTKYCQERAECVRMGRMEIAILGKGALRLKGKSASLVVNPASGMTGYNGALIVGKGGASATDAVVFDAPGEYEVGGVKISGFRGEESVAFNTTIDNINLLIGDIETLSKVQNKVKEADIVLIVANADLDAAFVSAYESSMIIFTGPAAETVVGKLSKENITKISKVVVTKDKLPVETQFVILE